MKKLSKEDKVAFFLVLAGTVMRFYHFNGWSLSNDELSALTRLKFDSFGEMIEKGVRTNDMHPAGVQSFLWVWTHLFGNSETAIRFPFVLAGSASVLLFYYTCKNFFGQASALLSTAVFAALQFPVLYSQLARPYSPGLFFSLLTVYAWSNIIWINKNWKWKDGWLFILGGIGCMYSHYFSFLFAGLVGLTGLFYLKGSALKKYLICGVVMFLLYIPNFNVLLTQFGIGGLGGPEGWLGPPKADAIWRYMVYCINDSIWLLLFFILVTALLIVQYHNGKIWTTHHSVALVFFILPALVAYFYSILKNPVFQYSILLFNFPFFIMLLFSWFKPLNVKVVHVITIVFLFLVTAYSTVIANGFYSFQFFAPFKNVAERCAFYSEKFSKGKVDATINVIHPDYIHYYSDKLTPCVTFLQYLCNRPEHFVMLKQLVEKSPANTFIHAWSNNYHAPETEMIIREKFPFLIEKDSFFNAGVLVYSRDSSLNKVYERPPLFELKSGFEDHVWTSDSSCINDSIYFAGGKSLLIGETAEYSQGFKEQAAVVGFKKGVTFKWKCRYFSLTRPNELKAVVSIDRNGENFIWRGYPLNTYPGSSGEWVEFYAGYKLVEDIREDDLVTIYFYNPAHEKVWIDDLEFRVEP